ncbi:hypothetical protein [Mangrovihabitans endophyticus]|uniref:Uncharacterized protein n=1 Tax=Mangrovihabitans endophyticus TaxID=1751298 RepID=A0A8J3FMJ5_9ACTN|nr:hypothetical protein [Mangrovihabitans endophyticus]GGK84497.1 hypothetical protein GCM10012284_18410 [Mangrovihabitans endophyticus]
MTDSPSDARRAEPETTPADRDASPTTEQTDAGDYEYDEAHQGGDGGSGVPGGQYGPPPH